MKILTILFPPFSVIATQEYRPQALSVQDTHPHELLQHAQLCPGFQSREKLFHRAYPKPSSSPSRETCISEKKILDPAHVLISNLTSDFATRRFQQPRG